MPSFLDKIRQARDSFGQLTHEQRINLYTEAVIEAAKLGKANLDIPAFTLAGRDTVLHFQNAIDNHGRSGLSHAAENGHLKCVKAFLFTSYKDSANPKFLAELKDDKGNTPLYYAVKNGHTKIVELLLGEKFDSKTNTINEAGESIIDAAAGNPDILALLEHPEEDIVEAAAAPIVEAAAAPIEGVAAAELPTANIDNPEDNWGLTGDCYKTE